jgi:hypothetical protein
MCNTFWELPVCVNKFFVNDIVDSCIGRPSGLKLGRFCPEDTSMPKKKITHPAAVLRIAHIADDYVPVSGDDPEGFAGDILADLLHWCKAEGVPFDVALRRAQMHFTAEQVEGVGR